MRTPAQPRGANANATMRILLLLAVAGVNPRAACQSHHHLPLLAPTHNNPAVAATACLQPSIGTRKRQQQRTAIQAGHTQYAHQTTLKTTFTACSICVCLQYSSCHARCSMTLLYRQVPLVNTHPTNLSLMLQAHMVLRRHVMEPTLNCLSGQRAPHRQYVLPTAVSAPSQNLLHMHTPTPC